MSKTETVKVTLELPKQIAEFIKESWSTDNLPEILTKEIVELCLSQIDCEAGEECIQPEELVKKYGLFSVFKQHELIPSYYEEELMK